MLCRPLQGNQLYVRAVSFDGSLRRMNTHFKTVSQVCEWTSFVPRPTQALSLVFHVFIKAGTTALTQSSNSPLSAMSSLMRCGLRGEQAYCPSVLVCQHSLFIVRNTSVVLPSIVFICKKRVASLSWRGASSNYEIVAWRPDHACQCASPLSLSDHSWWPTVDVGCGAWFA